MKALAIVTVVGALASPTLGFAQSTSPVTRAQVRSELARVEQAGYSPSAGEDVHYPDDILAAEAKVSAQSDAQYAANAMGGVTPGTSASGAPMPTPMHTYGDTTYRCTGPQSFCHVYSGS